MAISCHNTDKLLLSMLSSHIGAVPRQLSFVANYLYYKRHLGIYSILIHTCIIYEQTVSLSLYSSQISTYVQSSSFPPLSKTSKQTNTHSFQYLVNVIKLFLEEFWKIEIFPQAETARIVNFKRNKESYIQVLHKNSIVLTFSACSNNRTNFIHFFKFGQIQISSKKSFTTSTTANLECMPLTYYITTL